ncbi:MAG: methyltransferase domain-containing protein [Methyloceanibacter sp.]
MSSILRMLSHRSAAIARNFGAKAASYDDHADLQRTVAARLARLLPPLRSPRVLELGCGTGVFSRHLAERYPDGELILTDLAPAMVEQCRRNLGSVTNAGTGFEVMDAARPSVRGPYDLIATSMTLHWLADPEAVLARLGRLLAPGGALIYASIGPDSFAEWHAVLKARGLPRGLPELPSLPGIVDEDRLAVDAGTLAFLRRIKSIGGLTPRAGYTPLSPGALRGAIRATDAQHDGRVTWHIVYGCVEASQSSPSMRPA